MRVTTRRLRAALEIFEPCFPAKQHGEALDSVKRLADALGERRDRDDAIAALHNFNDQMASPDRRGVTSLIEQLRSEQEKAKEELALLVAEDNRRELRETMDALSRCSGAQREGSGRQEARPIPSARGERSPDHPGAAR